MSHHSELTYVGGKFQLRTKIGSGSFGSIFLGRNIHSKEDVAIKLEEADCKHPQIQFEGRMYQILRGGIGIPTMHWCGVDGKYNVLVLQLLGKSLEDLFEASQRRFSLKTVLMLADQMLRRVEYIHSKNIIHRDIKPDNFLLGRSPGEEGELYVIDFGLAKIYRNAKTHRHIMYRENKSLTGTARYASINTHLGIEQSRRDDLESVGYVLIYFLKGRLPWQGLVSDKKHHKYDRIKDKKLSTSVSNLCKELPYEFELYMNTVRSLRFADHPDYGYLRKMFRDLFLKEGFIYDLKYDWSP